MGRGRVPAALQSELAEYASLLRALQTSSALDVTSHLTRHSTPATSTAGDSEPDGQQVTVRDTWTRWPLLADDVYVPEWGLEDEIDVIATHALNTIYPSAATQTDEMEDDIDDSADESTGEALTLAASARLSQILALLAAHIPRSASSLQNRIRPIGWESVLDIVGASELFDETIMDRVQRRLEAIYSPTRNEVLPRTGKTLSRKRKLDELLAVNEQSLLTFPEASASAGALRVLFSRFTVFDL